MGKNNKRKFKIRAKGFAKILVGPALCSPAPICLAAGTTMLATSIPTYKETYYINNEEVQDEAILKENENAAINYRWRNSCLRRNFYRCFLLSWCCRKD